MNVEIDIWAPAGAGPSVKSATTFIRLEMIDICISKDYGV